MTRRSGASVGQPRQLVGVGAGAVDVADGEHDLDRRGEHRRVGELSAALLHHAADRGLGGIELAVVEAQQGEPRRRLAPVLAGRPVGPLGLRRLAPQAVQLAFLVERQPERRMGRLGQPSLGLLDLGRRLLPIAVGLQHLRAVHEALPPVGHEIGLAGAPVAEGTRPLGRSPEVHHVHAGLDHGAVHDPCRDRRDLA